MDSPSRARARRLFNRPTLKGSFQWFAGQDQGKGSLRFVVVQMEVLLKNALADMHECEPKNNVKRFGNGQKQTFEDQPRSAFRFFMEEFVKTCDHNENEVDIDKKGCETWKNMSQKERLPYVVQAVKVNSVYTAALLKEENDLHLSWVDDEADSADVMKYGKNFEGCEGYVDSEDADGYGIFWSETSESLDIKFWASMPPRMVEKSS